MIDLRGKVAIVTGAGRGIGEAIVYKMAAAGAKVVVVDINEDGVKQVALKADGNANNVLGLACDISKLDAVRNMVEQVVAKFGTVDILVNNAGITRDSMFHKMSPEQWQQVIDINLTGVFYVTSAVVPHMRANCYGKIVNISSVSAYGNIGQANYAASKSGVIGLTKSLAKELGRYNINVNVIEPGLIETEMIRSVPEQLKSEWIKAMPLGRLGTADDVANAVCFFASDISSFITGTELPVCGGSLII
ncbi:MAG TPA: 3-oxoacyl-ACP reductase FabG [Negativicutes bacterium]|jgi:NAD(P)-dependent dehydrogenase (short-subunit alcohol dehydrogenase family)